MIKIRIKGCQITQVLFAMACMVMGISTNLTGQQLPYTSLFGETRSIWNPAATAIHEEVNSSLFLREQWQGFSNAPRTGFLTVEYPFIEYNMSGGIGLIFDSSGPVSKVGAQLNYAYKLREVFTDQGQLSGGLSLGFSQYTFDPTKTLVRDDEDPIAANSRTSSIYPMASMGLFYTSNADRYDRDNVFFAGFSIAQIFSGEILVDGSDQKRQNHVFLEVGKRFQGFDSSFESSIQLNYANPDIVHLLFSGEYEMHDAFWLGLGFSSSRNLSFQGGVIVPGFGGRYSNLRIGALASYGIGDKASAFGAGYEILVAYEYDLK